MGSCRLHLLTSHLESCAEFSSERKAQLRQCLDLVTKGGGGEEGGNAVLAGDLNLRDHEVGGLLGLWGVSYQREYVMVCM